jgi:hypothetical protein
LKREIMEAVDVRQVEDKYVDNTGEPDHVQEEQMKNHLLSVTTKSAWWTKVRVHNKIPLFLKLYCEQMTIFHVASYSLLVGGALLQFKIRVVAFNVYIYPLVTRYPAAVVYHHEYTS